MNAVRTAANFIDRIVTVFETVFLCVAIGVMAVVLFAQVVCGFFHIDLAWAGELSMYLMVWVMCVGASAATRGRRHITIGVIADRLRGVPARVVSTAVSVGCAAACVALAVSSFGFVHMAFATGQKTVVLQLPMWGIYAALPSAAILLAVRFLLLIAAPPPSRSALDEEELIRVN